MFPNAQAYDQLVDAVGEKYGVPASLIKGIIAEESGFQERATHFDANVNDTSYGLMQVSSRIARQLGYTGDPAGLFDPAINLELGTHLLADNYARAGDWDVAIAAYNAGWSKERPNDAPRHADGSFWTADPNYVARVRNFQRMFAPAVADATGDEGGAIAPQLMTSLLSLGLSLAVWWFLRRRRRRRMA